MDSSLLESISAINVLAHFHEFRFMATHHSFVASVRSSQPSSLCLSTATERLDKFIFRPVLLMYILTPPYTLRYGLLKLACKIIFTGTLGTVAFQNNTKSDQDRTASYRIKSHKICTDLMSTTPSSSPMFRVLITRTASSKQRQPALTKAAVKPTTTRYQSHSCGFLEF